MVSEKSVSKKLVELILEQGFMISVNDGEEFVVKNSTDQKVICKALGSTEEDFLHVRDGEGKKVGFLWLVYGNAPDELVADYTANPLLDNIVNALDTWLGK